jgi:hypothetical protein
MVITRTFLYHILVYQFSNKYLSYYFIKIICVISRQNRM